MQSKSNARTISLNEDRLKAQNDQTGMLKTEYECLPNSRHAVDLTNISQSLDMTISPYNVFAFLFLETLDPFLIMLCAWIVGGSVSMFDPHNEFPLQLSHSNSESIASDKNIKANVRVETVALPVFLESCKVELERTGNTLRMLYHILESTFPQHGYENPAESLRSILQKAQNSPALANSHFDSKSENDTMDHTNAYNRVKTQLWNEFGIPKTLFRLSGESISIADMCVQATPKTKSSDLVPLDILFNDIIGEAIRTQVRILCKWKFEY